MTKAKYGFSEFFIRSVWGYASADPPAGATPRGGVWRAAGIARRPDPRGIKHLRAPPSLRGGIVRRAVTIAPI